MKKHLFAADRLLLLASASCLLTTALYSHSAGAATLPTLAFTNEGNFLDTFGVNPIGVGTPIGTSAFYSGGTYDSVFAWVTPSGPPTDSGGSTPSSDGTTVTAAQGGQTYLLPYSNSKAFPNQFFENLPVGQTGQWNLTANSEGAIPTTVGAQTPALVVTTTPPENTAVAITGSTLAPTISWTIPPTAIPPGSVLRDSVYLFAQASQGSGALYASGELPPGTTQVSIPTGVLASGQVYSISIQSDIINPNQTTGAIEARTRQFTAYIAASAANIPGPIYLPAVTETASLQFDIPVTAAIPVLLDPLVATGFIYQTGATDPNFASVLLPNIGNSQPYRLYTWNGMSFVFATDLAANTLFGFGADGVSEFEVLGIDPSLGLDPNSGTDFVTQVTFTGSGTFTGTMTPITTSVPEPSTWAMMLLGFAGLGFMGYRHRIVAMLGA